MSKKKANSTDDLINFLQDFIPNPEKVIKDTRAYLFKVGGEIISDLSSNPPWENKSGELNRSLSRGFEGPLSVSLSANAKYAKWLYNGTKRHFIKPENGDTLSWTFGGKRYYSKGHWVSGVWAGKRRNGRSRELGLHQKTQNNSSGSKSVGRKKELKLLKIL